MKKFFIIVIAVTLCAIIGYGIAYFVSPVRTAGLEEFNYEIATKCDGAYIVREESVYYATSPGTVYNIADEGERVANNTAISAIYASNIDTSHLSELRTLDKRIKLLSGLSAGRETYETGEASVENEISSRMGSVIDASKSNSVETVRSYREDINAYRKGSDENAVSALSVLEAERGLLEAKISSGKRDILSNRSGIFSSYVDGLESVLAPERIADYNPQYIRSLTLNEINRDENAAVVVGDPVCKVMNNHEWYVLGVVNKDKTSLCTEGTPVTLRFPGTAASDTKGTITFVSPADENGESMFLVKIPTYVESAFSYRQLDAEIIFKSYSGYKVPTYAIRTDAGISKYYVNGMKGSESYKCDVEVVYTDTEQEYSIIRSVDTAENKLGSMDRVIVGEK